MNPELKPVIETIGSIVLGKPNQVRLALACLLARGHLLVEDIPGVGKTTLALTVAQTLGLQFQRLQFTSDLLPADILGVSIFEPSQGSFRFHPGPIFAQLVLADEVNRASPKTQSALLEAMEERQVTIEGETRALPTPFFVIATQNPQFQIGTYPLPESQLDRFLMRISLGYPPLEAERELIAGGERRDRVAGIERVLSPESLMSLQRAVQEVRTSPALIDYLLALIHHTREHGALRHGLSPRGGLALRRAAQAWAFLDGRSGVLPEDVQAVFAAVVEHRLAPAASGTALPSAAQLLAEVPIP